MPINPLNNHYAVEGVVSVYDEEAMTALQLAGRTTAKVNECVEAVNTIPDKVANDVMKHIQGGAFAQQIDKHTKTILNGFKDTEKAMEVSVKATEQAMRDDFREAEQALNAEVNSLKSTLGERVDALLGKVVEGSTTMDAEIIDARFGADAKDFTSLGQALRTQFSESLMKRTPQAFNANVCTNTGVYVVGSSDGWENVPAGAGLLIVVNGDAPSRLYQIFLSYLDSLIYTRRWENSVFNEWVKSADNKATVAQKIATIKNGVIDTTTLETGFYIVSSATKYSGLPDNYVAGILLVMGDNTGMGSQEYQIFIGYSSNAMYVRSKVAGVHGEWNKISFVGSAIAPVGGGGGKPYTVAKVSNNGFHIIKTGSAGYIRYKYIRDTQEAIHLDTYRLETVTLLDGNMNEVGYISGSGVDLEGVVMLSGDTDHLGGVHGDEQATAHYLYIDGRPYTLETVPEQVECDEVRVIVKSNILHQDGGNVCMVKIKQTTFDKDGVHINCEWEALETLTFESIRGAMFSIQKDCFTHYYDSHVNRFPIQASAVSGESATVSEDPNVTDMFYVGKVSAHHWTEERNGETSTLVVDYGSRLKSYFNCYDNHTAQAGEKMSAINHFNITC